MIQLINVPFGSIMRAPMALGTFKAQLAQAQLPVEVHHLNFLLAKIMGVGAYETIARFKGVETQVSEWLFARAAWRRPFGLDDDTFLSRCGDEIEAIPNVSEPVAWLRKIRDERIDAYLEKCYQRLVRRGPQRVVAFSCMFFQTIAALAIGRMIKERHPETTLVYGGACFHGDAGVELLENVPWIDVVSTGEADEAIVPLFRALDANQTPPPLPGVCVRDRVTRAITSGGPPPNTSGTVLDALPDPDYTEFFADAERVGLLDDPVWLERASLPFEASRGCWWGQKKHCSFCGLNGDGMEFRVKSAERVEATVRRLAADYPTRNLQATDNILAMSYWKSLLPALVKTPLVHPSGKPVDLFFEIKPNLTRAQIKALADANIVYVQPGIESLSTHLLQAFDKGITAIQNVFFLKCATEYGLLPLWNLLIRVPGERAEDYAEMCALIPQLHHLRPPTGGAPRVECHRYSPYFARENTFVTEVRPATWYRGIYPDDEIDLSRVAYYFDVTWKNTLGDPTYDPILVATRIWSERWVSGTQPRLTMYETLEGLVLEDSRGEDVVGWQLDAQQSQVYRCLGDITTIDKIRTELSLPDATIRSVLAALIERGLVMRENARYLGLALPPVDDAPMVTRSIRRITNQRPTQLSPARLPVIP